MPNGDFSAVKDQVVSISTSFDDNIKYGSHLCGLTLEQQAYLLRS